MSSPTQGSDAWYKDAAEKLSSFSEKAQNHVNGQSNAFDTKGDLVQQDTKVSGVHEAVFADPSIAEGYGID